MEMCKVGDSPLFPNSPISEFNPCIQGEPPFGHYIPDAYKGNYTVPGNHHSDNPLGIPNIFKSKESTSAKALKSKISKARNIIKNSLLVVVGLILLGGVVIILKKKLKNE